MLKSLQSHTNASMIVIPKLMKEGGQTSQKKREKAISKRVDSFKICVRIRL
ncbi:hypothetical protein D3C77_630050 [compost metagenome]